MSDHFSQWKEEQLDLLNESEQHLLNAETLLAPLVEEAEKVLIESGLYFVSRPDVGSAPVWSRTEQL